MTTRTSSKTVTFCRSFCIGGVNRLLPPADYQVVTEEELIESLSFLAYRRVSTSNTRVLSDTRVSTTMIVPGEAGSTTVETVTIDPLDLQAAQEEDAVIGT